jgi:formamidopyrimidine-DNA glycosylase
VPELPDVTVYQERLAARLVGDTLRAVRLRTPFLLRTAAPPLASVHGHRLVEVRRIGKHLALGFDGAPWLVIHLMIAGRLRWRAAGSAIPAKGGLAAFDFDRGTVLFTEAGTKRRARLHVVADEAGLSAFHRGGIDPLTADVPAVAAQLRRENHTLKRALTDPRLFDGIGGAYADEILFAAGLGPLTWTQRLSEEEVARLTAATAQTLRAWTDRLRAEVGEGFPEKVTAFHPDMAVHGRYREPCRACGSPVQRIVYAERETNYCATCQTGGTVYADRALSQLLRGDWPKTLEGWEALHGGGT